MDIVVTGFEGFVGLHLCNVLVDQGHRVIGLDIKNGNDIRSCWLPRADRVYHLAAQTNAQEPDTIHDADTNIMGTLRILQHYGSKVVFASSSMVNYPVCPYAISKRAGEAYAKLYGAAVVRFCNLHGQFGHSVIDRFSFDPVLTIRGTGEQLRTYARVEDAITALLNAKPGDEFILPGRDLTVNQIAAWFPQKEIRREKALETDILDGRQLTPGAWSGASPLVLHALSGGPVCAPVAEQTNVVPLRSRGSGSDTRPKPRSPR